MVYASSAAVYGDVGDRAATESMALVPKTAYGADKLGSELHARVGWDVHGVPSLGLRFFNVYGPRQDAGSPYSGVISLFVHRLAEGAAVTIHGDGGQTRDFVYVADVVSHLQAAMDRLRGSAGSDRAEVMNVCTGRSVTVRALALMLGELTGVSPRLLAAPARPGDIRYSRGDPSRASVALGVCAETTLPKGLAALLRHEAGRGS